MGFLDWFRKKDPRDAFADRLLRQLRQGGEKRPVRYDKERLCIDVGREL